MRDESARDRPELLDDPQQMIQVLSGRFHWFAGLILLLTVLYVVVMRLTAKPESAPQDAG